MRTALQHVRARKLTGAQRVAAAKKAYGLVQLRTDYAAEYRAGMDARDRGELLMDHTYEAASLEAMAWMKGWREAQRQEGD